MEYISSTFHYENGQIMLNINFDVEDINETSLEFMNYICENKDSIENSKEYKQYLIKQKLKEL